MIKSFEIFSFKLFFWKIRSNVFIRAIIKLYA